MMTLALLLSVLAPQDDLDRSRAAVGRSLPYLEKEGVAWIQKRDCLSCHVVTFLLWSHEAARAKGIAVDLNKLAEWSDWSRKESTAAFWYDSVPAAWYEARMNPPTAARSPPIPPATSTHPSASSVAVCCERVAAIDPVGPKVPVAGS